MKVVVNKCYGGFGLSPVALQWLIDHGIPLYTDSEKIPDNVKYWISKYKSAITGKEELFTLSFDSCENRANSLLVECVETLGKEANGIFADLVVVDIPDNIEWSISDYDGIESVEEKHRSW